jgi:hypothetical protein
MQTFHEKILVHRCPVNSPAAQQQRDSTWLGAVLLHMLVCHSTPTAASLRFMPKILSPCLPLC